MIYPKNSCVWIAVGIITCGAPVANSEELGRLFFDAAERQAMNDKRLSPKPKPIASVTKKESPAPEPKEQAEVTESVRLRAPKITGKVIRSSGNNTLWVNQYPQYQRRNKLR